MEFVFFRTSPVLFFLAKESPSVFFVLFLWWRDKEQYVREDEASVLELLSLYNNSRLHTASYVVKIYEPMSSTCSGCKWRNGQVSHQNYFGPLFNPMNWQ
ncbi:hypothetical protein CIPAW_11G100500 [Carya illinoinensis]|uniref:Uncharacterized protein n=1 Tax=Carya illinoinensis TaxID=32201 RepID=A0A8T1P3C1_CARIL|nr:hypothetical protein CIPAW_11G100500 [Carya illinoinensis]